jgi:ketosteroid isomerase-like protein
MTPIEVFHHMHELVRGYDIRAVDSFAADGVLELPFAPPGMAKRLVGRDAIRALLAPRYEVARATGRRIAGYRSLVVHETRDPDVIIAEFEVDGVPRGAGTEPTTLAFIQVFRVVDGEIALQRDYFDSYVMAERLRVS